MKNVIANMISILFHPLLMVTYGVILALSYTYLAVYPLRLRMMIAVGTFISSAVIPGLFILLLIRTGGASDMELTNRRERPVPFLIIIMSYILCFYYLYKLNMPFWLLSVLVGACVALVFALCINFVWKISAHAIGIGGLLGAVMGIAHLHMSNPYWAFIFLFIAMGIVSTSRILLKKHTPMQVYAGACLGFICTFTASLLSYLYLFI